LNGVHLEEYYSEQIRRTKGGDSCLMFWKVGFIYPDGSVMPSNACYFHSMGNIFHEEFKTIWNGDKYRALRRHVRKNGWIPFCSRCYCSYGSWV
jgi:MoaA/NifB/PqqE/SkfB family radical SAM enzyme